MSDESAPPPESLHTELADLRRQLIALCQENQRLRASEERYQQLVELLPDPVIVHNGKVVLFANPAAARLYGVSHPQAMIDLPITRLVSPHEQSSVRERVQAVLAGQQVPVTEEQLLRQDGTSYWAEVTSTPLIYQDQRAAQVIVRDISERKQAEARLRQQNIFLTLLQEAVIQVLASADLNSVLRTIAQHAGQLLETPHVVIGLVDETRNHLDRTVGLGLLTQSLGTNLQPGEGLVGQVWLTGQPLIVNDYDLWSQHTTTFHPRTIRAVAGVPLIIEHQVIGVLSLAHHFETGRTFTPDDVSRLLMLRSIR